MSQNWKRPLIESRKREIARYLSQLDEADDLDMWEEASAKLNDVMVIWHRNQAAKVFGFTDGQRRAMDYVHALSDVYIDKD